MIESDCCIDNESEVTNLLATDSDDNHCNGVGEDTTCEVLVLMGDVMGTVDVNLVVRTDEKDDSCVAKRVEFPTKVVENNVLV